MPQLTLVRREHPNYNMHLFGYPEWQTYTQDHLASFYELDTYFYSSFYTNNLFPEAINFTQLTGAGTAKIWPIPSPSMACWIRHRLFLPEGTGPEKETKLEEKSRQGTGNSDPERIQV